MREGQGQTMQRQFAYLFSALPTATSNRLQTSPLLVDQRWARLSVHGDVQGQWERFPIVWSALKKLSGCPESFALIFSLPPVFFVSGLFHML